MSAQRLPLTSGVARDILASTEAPQRRRLVQRHVMRPRGAEQSVPINWSRGATNAFRKMDGWLTGPFGIRNDPDDRVAEAQPKAERV